MSNWSYLNPGVEIKTYSKRHSFEMKIMQIADAGICTHNDSTTEKLGQQKNGLLKKTRFL